MILTIGLTPNDDVVDTWQLQEALEGAGFNVDRIIVEIAQPLSIDIA